MAPRGYCDAAGHYSASEHGGMVHAVILGSGLYGLENVAHADRLLPPGATIIALPMKIKGGSGAPMRIIAVLPW